MARRWHELPQGRAIAASEAVRDVLGQLAVEDGIPAAVPDLGPAALPDQLAVLVWDACAAGRSDGLDARLAALRRAIG